ncbi:MAG: hypothetical protein R3B06_13040 [Kofleriaceae bacterium]
MTMTPDEPDRPAPPATPAEDSPATEAERARARAFADLIDKVVAGRPPAAVSSEDQDLLEVATVIRAATRPAALPARRTEALIEGALATAIERRAGRAGPGRRRGGGGADQRRGCATAARAPWLVAAATSLVAAAALLCGRASYPPLPGRRRRDRHDRRGAPRGARSRPADALVGVIAPPRPVPRSIASTRFMPIDSAGIEIVRWQEAADDPRTMVRVRSPQATLVAGAAACDALADRAGGSVTRVTALEDAIDEA